MATKISVWAFNEFSKFDSFIAMLGCAPKAESLDYSRANTVKMVNTDHHFKMSLHEFLYTFEKYNPKADMDMVRKMFFKQDGELRKLEGKEIKLQADGFFITFEF